MDKIKQTDIDFFKYDLAIDSPIISIPGILEWIDMIRNDVIARIEQITIEKMRLWKFDEIIGNIVHESGRFFQLKE